MKKKIFSYVLAVILSLNLVPTIIVNADQRLGIDFSGPEAVADWTNTSNARFEVDSVIGNYMVVDGNAAASAPKTPAFDAGNYVCVEFDMMLPSLKSDGTTQNAISGGNTGGIAFMEGDNVAGVIGFRGSSGGTPDNILSKGAAGNDYVNALAGNKASAYFDTWMHYIFLVNTETKKGDFYMVDPKTGTVYNHETRFDGYISSISKLTHIGVVSNSGYAIGVANLKIYEPTATAVMLTAEDNMNEQYLPAEGNTSTIQYNAKPTYILTYNKSGNIVNTETSIDMAGANVIYSIENESGTTLTPQGISISNDGLLCVEHNAIPDVYFVKASSGDMFDRLQVEVRASAPASVVQVAGKEEVEKDETINLKSISIAQTGAVLPEKEMIWEFVGDSLGSTLNNGEFTSGNTSGKVTIKATSVENGVFGILDIYIREQEEINNASVSVEGVILGDGTTAFGETNSIYGVALKSDEEIQDVKVLVSVFDKSDVCQAREEYDIPLLEKGAYKIETPVEIKKASYIRVIVISDNKVVTGELIDIEKGIYKGIPMVADWITGKNSGLGMGTAIMRPQNVPAGINPDLVNTFTSQANYIEDNYNEVIKENVTTNNLLWYKTGAWSNKNTATIYARDGDDWEQQALPIGNGYMGAMLFGMPAKDHIQFNEETFWAAGYRGTQSSVSSTQVNPNMSEGINGYMNAGNIFVDFGLPTGASVKNYYRDLNIEESVSHVQYEYDNVKYKREYFASYPNEVVVMRYTTDQVGKLNFTVNPVSAHPGDITVNNGEITIIGKLKDSEPYSSGGNATWNQESDLEYCTKVKVILNSDDGELIDNYGNVTVKDATDVYVVFAASTDYDPDRFVLDSSGKADANVVQYKHERGIDYAIEKTTNRINNAVKLSYDELKKLHIEDYKSQFDNVNFKLTDTISTTPTNELQASYNKVLSGISAGEKIKKSSENAYNNLDKHLEELHFNYARYMMISSSRATTMPANLQGKWCQSVAEIWGSCYCININMEMNYWFVGGANLLDSGKALVKWFNSQIPAGKITAKNYYKVTPKSYSISGNTINFTNSTDEKDNVFIMHTKQAINGTTDLTGSTNIQSPGNTAWLMYNLWDLYQTTGDKDMLEKEIYPIMRQAANFYTQYMYTGYKKNTSDTEKYPKGYYYTTGSGRSPEHGPTHEGQKYDLQLVAGMFDYTIEAAKILGIDTDKVLAWEEIRNNMESPVELGDDGQIKEWAEETYYNQDKSGNSLGDGYHRHISGLVALYPGNLITRETPELLNGAAVVLDKRGDEATGWSSSNKFLLWARALDGDKALELFRFQLAQKTYSNLFDTHAPFQIDGNFGSAAGVMELLMQSQTGIVYLLPALPEVWDNGEITGVKSKTGAEIDIKWDNNKLTEAKITPVHDGDVKLGYDIEDMNLKVVDENGAEQVLSEVNGVYTLKNAKKDMTYLLTTTTEEATPTTDYTIKSINSNDNGYSVVVNKNNSNISKGHILIVAAYESDGRLTEVKIVDISDGQKGENTYLVDILKGDNVKAFVWDGITTMVPLT